MLLHVVFSENTGYNKVLLESGNIFLVLLSPHTCGSDFALPLYQSMGASFFEICKQGILKIISKGQL